MRRLYLLAIALGAAVGPAPARPQGADPVGEPVARTAACGARLAEAAAEEGITASPIVADFTLDGSPDALVWGVIDGVVVIRIARCAGDDVDEQWRFPIEPEGECDTDAAMVRPGSLKLDAASVERVCAQGRDRDECVHLRRENERRQDMEAAGGREVRIEVPGCAALGLVWSPELGGFTTMPR